MTNSILCTEYSPNAPRASQSKLLARDLRKGNRLRLRAVEQLSHRIGRDQGVDVRGFVSNNEDLPQDGAFKGEGPAQKSRFQEYPMLVWVCLVFRKTC